MTFVSELEPRPLWRHFDRILEIPRGSGDEEAVRAYVLEVAARNGLDHQVDAVGNVVVRKPASAGREDAAITALQSHLDMVNEKNADVDHDFAVDPIRPDRSGEYLMATGTTLGSDNGIGVAAMLAMMEDDVAHPPLELLFTVDEETGLTGAAGLDPTLLQARRLINLDTEEEGAIYVGCAGGGDSRLELPIAREAAPGDRVALRIAIRGLKGGHSGVDIHLQRGNAVKLLARILAAAAGADARLAHLAGGNMHNAIPREAEAVILVPAGREAAFRDRAGGEVAAVLEAFGDREPDLDVEVAEAEAGGDALDADSTWRVLNALQGLPHGVVAMSRDIPDLVETSTNLASVRLEDDAARVLTSTRSSVASELEACRATIRAIGELAGGSVHEEAAYPGWRPDLESPLLDTARTVFRDDLDREPEVKAIHAGLETGIIGEKVAGMDMISIGPQIEFPHSPDERVRIPSVGDFYRILVAILERLD